MTDKVDNDQCVKITAFNLIGEDERGFTKDISLPREVTNLILLRRKAGVLSGNTYHEGKNKATKPKLFILIEGEIKFIYRHIDNQEHTSILITDPSIIEVAPYTVHAVEAITNIIILEGNSIADIQNDRIKAPVQI